MSFCSRFLRLSVFPWCKDTPQISPSSKKEKKRGKVTVIFSFKFYPGYSLLVNLLFFFLEGINLGAFEKTFAVVRIEVYVLLLSLGVLISALLNYLSGLEFNFWITNPSG